MTIGAVYASDLSRVRISCSAAPALADYATIERSVDQITWVTVRGGGAVTLVGNACSLDDYEFVPGVVNYYRATYVDTLDPTVIAAGTASQGNNATVTPGLPAGVLDGDILLCKAAIRNTAATVNAPAGWTTLVSAGHFKIFSRVYTAGVTAPTITFTGGATGDSTLARMVNVRNADFNVSATAMKSNASAQDIAFDGVNVAALTPNLLVVSVWKQSTATGATIPGWFLMSNDATSVGNAEFMAFFGITTSSNQAAQSVVMSGGAAAISKSTVMRFTRRAYVSRETATITPSITTIQLKNIARPFLNRSIIVTGFSPVVRPSRSGVFDIVGRTNAVAVNELRGAPRFTITIKTETAAQADDLTAVLAAGETVLLQLPYGFKRFPGGYYQVGDLTTRPSPKAFGTRRYHDLPLVGVAAPSSSVVGVTITYQGVITAYATYADLMAANATYADLLNRIGTPADVVVP